MIKTICVTMTRYRNVSDLAARYAIFIQIGSVTAFNSRILQSWRKIVELWHVCISSPIDSFRKWANNLSKTYRSNVALVVPDNRRRYVTQLRVMVRRLEGNVRRIATKSGTLRKNMGSLSTPILATQLRRMRGQWAMNWSQ